MIHNLFSASVLSLLICLPSAQAGVITVENFDFETFSGGTLPGDGFATNNPGVVPDGWSLVGDATGDVFYGYFNPIDFNYTGTTGAPGLTGSMSGENLFYFGDLDDGDGIEQTLSAVFTSNTDYEVTVGMGRRQTELNQNLRIDLFAGATLLETITHDGSTVPFDAIEDRSLNYTFNIADAGLVGSALRIRFTEIDAGGFQDNLDIDNVRVNGVVGVPEPSTAGMMLVVGTVALFVRRRRVQNK